MTTNGPHSGLCSDAVRTADPTMNPILLRILFNALLAGGLALVFFATQRNWGGTAALIGGVVLIIAGAAGLMFTQPRMK